MGGYTQRVRDSILPLSVAGTLPDAFAEWSFTESTIDHEAPVETCQLCGQQELRYHFEIANAYTDGSLWVGSHCILQFDVAVLDAACPRRKRSAISLSSLRKCRWNPASARLNSLRDPKTIRSFRAHSITIDERRS